jgi:hypothetical protein
MKKIKEIYARIRGVLMLKETKIIFKLSLVLLTYVYIVLTSIAFTIGLFL